jgi:phytoene dehydrogenase-like protein
MTAMTHADTADHHPLPGPPDATRRRQRNELPAEVDVAVIGCGLSGLTAGAYLARAGLRVACFDSHYVAGGCGTVFARSTPHGRYHFDVGLHYVGDCGPTGTIPTILRDAGCPPVNWRPLDPDGFDTIVLPDLEFRIPANLDLYHERLRAAFPRETRGIDRYVSFLRGVADVGARLDANGGRMTPGIIWRVLSKHRMLARYQNATIAQVLDGCTSDPALRAVILGQHGDYGLPPSKVAALLHAGLAVHYFKGAVYPEGGGQTLADRLAAAIEAAGGTIHLSRGIGRVLVENGRAVGVETAPRKNRETEQVRARVVISSADLVKTLRDLVPHDALPETWRRKLARGWESTSALFITCLGLAGDLRDIGMRNSNYWISKHLDIERAYASMGAGAPEVHGAYITSASLKDPGTPHHAPPGHMSLEVMGLVSGKAAAWGLGAGEEQGWGYKRNEVYRGHKQRVEDALVDMLEKRFPGATERIVFRESATPMSHTRFTQATDGSAYGIALTPEQFGRGRPGYEAIFPGFHLAGVSTRDNHGIVGAMSSGRSAAKAVLAAIGATRATATIRNSEHASA